MNNKFIWMFNAVAKFGWLDGKLYFRLVKQFCHLGTWKGSRDAMISMNRNADCNGPHRLLNAYIPLAKGRSWRMKLDLLGDNEFAWTRFFSKTHRWVVRAWFSLKDHSVMASICRVYWQHLNRRNAHANVWLVWRGTSMTSSMEVIVSSWKALDACAGMCLHLKVTSR